MLQYLVEFYVEKDGAINSPDLHFTEAFDTLAKASARARRVSRQDAAYVVAVESGERVGHAFYSYGARMSVEGRLK